MTSRCGERPRAVRVAFYRAGRSAPRPHNLQHLPQATVHFMGYAGYEAHGSTKARYQAGGFIMKAWLNSVCWNLAVALGFIEPPRLQPIPVRAQRNDSATPKR